MISYDEPPRYKPIETTADLMSFNGIINDFKYVIEAEFEELKKREEQQMKDVDEWFAIEVKKLEADRTKRKSDIRKKIATEFSSKNQKYRAKISAMKTGIGWFQWLSEQVNIK
jgi:hypothetical protein